MLDKTTPTGARVLLAVVLAVLICVGVADPSAARATRVEKADRHAPARLAYLEPLKVRNHVPRLLYVELRDGSAWLVTPCKRVQTKRCFNWHRKTMHFNHRRYSLR